MLEFDDPAFPHKELTSAIIGAAFEVDNELGYCFLERVYQRALQVELLRRGFQAELEKRIIVRYKDAVVGNMTLICSSRTVLSLKLKSRRNATSATKRSCSTS